MTFTLLFIGYQEILVIFLLVLVLFGGRKIPELARGIGQGIKEFNKARNSIQDELEQGIKEDRKPSEGQQQANQTN